MAGVAITQLIPGLKRIQLVAVEGQAGAAGCAWVGVIVAAAHASAGWVDVGNGRPALPADEQGSRRATCAPAGDDGVAGAQNEPVQPGGVGAGFVLRAGGADDAATGARNSDIEARAGDGGEAAPMGRRCAHTFRSHAAPTRAESEGETLARLHAHATQADGACAAACAALGGGIVLLPPKCPSACRACAAEYGHAVALRRPHAAAGDVEDGSANKCSTAQIIYRCKNERAHLKPPPKSCFARDRCRFRGHSSPCGFCRRTG